jgi:hypothetical protein
MVQTIQKLIATIKKLDEQQIELYQQDHYFADHMPDQVGESHTYTLPISYSLDELNITENEAQKLPKEVFRIENLRKYGQSLSLYFNRDILSLKRTVKVKARRRP